MSLEPPRKNGCDRGTAGHSRTAEHLSLEGAALVGPGNRLVGIQPGSTRSVSLSEFRCGQERLGLRARACPGRKAPGGLGDAPLGLLNPDGRHGCGFRQTETWTGLVEVKGSPVHPAHRSVR